MIPPPRHLRPFGHATMVRRLCAVVFIVALGHLPGHAAPPTSDADRSDRILAALPPGLRPFALPLPPLHFPDPNPFHHHTSTPNHAPDRTARLAFVATIAHRANDTHRFADSPAWRRIARWPTTPAIPFTTKYTSPERSPALFPVPAARHDPALDFAASVALANLDTIDFTCNFPRRARFLANHGLMPTPLATDTGRCRRLRRWLDPDRVLAIDAIYATPSWNDPSASLGHILFRIRLGPRTEAGADSSEPVFAWVASETEDDVDAYVWRGLTGGLTASVDISSMADVIRNYVRDEGRDLHVFELQLSRKELLDLVHVVDAQNALKMAQDYAFFTDNCASLAWDTLASVLDDLPDITRTLAHPHGVLSRLVTLGRARPLGILRSSRTTAKIAEDTRDTLFGTLASATAFPAAIPDSFGGAHEPDTTPAAAHQAFLRLHAARHAPRPTREAAARAFAYALTPLPPLPDPTATALAHYVDAVLAIESHRLDLERGRFDPKSDPPIIRDLLAARAHLPPTAAPPLATVATAPVTPSGSHLMTVALGAASNTRTTATLTHALVEEQLGEARQVSLRRGGRTVLLRNAVTLTASPGETPALGAWHFTVADILAPGDGLWTGPGVASGSLGFQVAAALQSRPDTALDLGFTVRGGPTWTLFNRNDFADHVIMGLDAEIAARSFATGFQTALAAGLSLVAAIQDRATGTTLRGRVRFAPEIRIPVDFGTSFEAMIQADLALDGHRGLLLRPAVSWQSSQSTGHKRWDLSLGIIF